jgi:hypothetical protein
MHKNTNISQSNKENFNNNDNLLFRLSDFEKKKVEVSFSVEQVSSDGGLLLLHEVEKQIGLVKKLTGCIDDHRHQSYVDHSIDALLRQRIMQIAAGYEDGNDCNTLRNDGVLKLCSGNEQSLAAQSTMCRFENQPGAKQLYKMGKAFVDSFVGSYAKAPGMIILDCDDTNALVYGQQELALFNTYYGDHCYMPLHIYEGLSGKLILTLLKPGRRSKSLNIFSLMKKLINYLHQQWPGTLIILRGDSHFCSKDFMDWSEGNEKVRFITGIASNAVLNRLAEVTINSAKREYKQYAMPVKRYHSFEYKAETWKYTQRVVVKVEVSSMGTNVRFIVSNLRSVRSKDLYEKGYCARAAAELRIKDHKIYLRSDRMSCNSFMANQFRLFLHSAAYVLIHTLQNQFLKGTEFCKATMKTIQLKLIKVTARVKIMKSKVKIELPVSFYTRWVFEKCFTMFEEIRT